MLPRGTQEALESSQGPTLSLAEGVQLCPHREGSPGRPRAVRDHHPAWSRAIMGFFFPALENGAGAVTAQSPFLKHGMEDATQPELYGSLGVRRASVCPWTEGVH